MRWMDEESFARFVESSGNEFELEHLESEPPEPSWCAGTSAGTGWDLVEDSQHEPSSSHADESVVFANIENHVKALFHSLPLDVPKQVWETGIWPAAFSDCSLEDALGLFGGELRRPVASPLQPDVELVAGSLKRKKSAETCKEVDGRKVDISWREQMDAALQSIVKLWYMLISRWNSECRIYQSLLEAEDEGAALRMLLDIFAGKSPYTLRKRALALMRLCDYL